MRNGQSGNAVVFLLLAIALFAALAYSFMRGSQGTTSQMSTQQAKLAAQELANHFQMLERGISKLRLRGCSVEHLNFVNPTDTGSYALANTSSIAPVDHSCDLFHPSGAAITFNLDLTKLQIPVAQNTLDPSQNGHIFYRLFNQSIVNVGTTANEYNANITFVRPEICVAYNKLIAPDVVLTIPEVALPWGDVNTTLAGKTSACVATASDFYFIYYVWMVN